ncbi:hypothetical protein [Aestuariivirga litoralis]|uniref:hypothetical protein n=1 Tax=Aestuariivirga litoralis TaxID=2650924 RepID=UPI0018C46B27|nr:hypothetical protein [Aestuariivirga litoralis]MBG1232077.1 hypothetical protein [Aestuariivirga litoralis]
MTKAIRFFFALPALISGLAVAWIVAAEHQLLPGPQVILAKFQQIPNPRQLPVPASHLPQNTRL